ncbi:MAG: hypothetical protein ABJA82_08685 [Myxococcales bacterium]
MTGHVNTRASPVRVPVLGGYGGSVRVLLLLSHMHPPLAPGEKIRQHPKAERA